MHDDISVVWIVTNPRTGSTWATNVVSEICRLEGLPKIPKVWPFGEKQTVAYGVAHLERQAPGVAVLKTHAALPPGLRRSVGIITRRDVRDAAISYMKFMRLDFERALSFARSSLARTPEVLFPGERRLVIDHPEITTAPSATIQRIAKFLGSELSAKQADETAASFSKEQVRKRIDKIDGEVRALVDAGQPVKRKNIVVLSPENWRAMDDETYFQTGHVTDYVDGDWRKVLTMDQQSRLQALIDEVGRNLI